MKTRTLLALSCALLVSDARSEGPGDVVTKLDASFFEASIVGGGRDLVEVSEELSEWYPHALMGLLEPEVESSTDIERIVVNSHYQGLQGEHFWMSRLAARGDLNDDFVERLISRRASSVVGSYPVSSHDNHREILQFASLLSSYWNMNDQAVLKAVEFNLPRWSKEEALLPVLILSLYDVEDYKNRLMDYQMEDHVEVQRIVSAIVESKRK